MGLEKSLERMALAMERIANRLDEQAASQKKVEQALTGLADFIPGEEVPRMEPPHVVDWFIDTNSKERSMMVRLSDGSTRPATNAEKVKMK